MNYYYYWLLSKSSHTVFEAALLAIPYDLASEEQCSEGKLGDICLFHTQILHGLLITCPRFILTDRHYSILLIRINSVITSFFMNTILKFCVDSEFFKSYYL